MDQYRPPRAQLTPEHPDYGNYDEDGFPITNMLTFTRVSIRQQYPYTLGDDHYYNDMLVHRNGRFWVLGFLGPSRKNGMYSVRLLLAAFHNDRPTTLHPYVNDDRQHHVVERINTTRAVNFLADTTKSAWKYSKRTIDWLVGLRDVVGDRVEYQVVGAESDDDENEEEDKEDDDYEFEEDEDDDFEYDEEETEIIEVDEDSSEEDRVLYYYLVTIQQDVTEYKFRNDHYYYDLLKSCRPNLDRSYAIVGLIGPTCRRGRIGINLWLASYRDTAPESSFPYTLNPPRLFHEAEMTTELVAAHRLTIVAQINWDHMQKTRNWLMRLPRVLGYEETNRDDDDSNADYDAGPPGILI